jgi:hypothetical protein
VKDRPAVLDAIVAAEGLLNHHWLFLLDAPGERERLGIKYLSLGYGSSPRWSLWFADTPGVYRLELRKAVTVSGYDWLAEIKVKYYPSPDEASFAGLSIYEQVCRTGDAFRAGPAEGTVERSGCACHGGSHFASGEKRFADLTAGTGVPSSAYQDVIPQDFFFTGGLLLAYCERRGTRARWESQDRWRVRLTADCAIAGEDGSVLMVRRAGEIDRDYPGFFLTDRVCRRFVDGWSRFHGYRERDERRHEEAGTEFSSDGELLTPANTSEIHRIVVEVACRRTGIEELSELPC